MRRFRPDPLPPAVLTRILETATFAPSAHNRQPWRFVVLTAPEAKARLAEAMGAVFRCDLEKDGLPEAEIAARLERSHRRILQSPVAIVLCLDTTAGDTYPNETRQRAEYLMGVQSVAMAGNTLLLAAHAEGLGGVWVCAPLFAPQAARRTLDLPESWQPQALLLLGYPAETPQPRPRRGLAEVARFL